MGSGKGEVVKILETLGYRYISLSDIVREEIAKLGREVSREETQDIGNRLRREGGAGVLGKRVREKIQTLPHPPWIIDGIRNPAEIDELKKLPGFSLIAVDADMDIILKRIKERKRTTDLLADEELLKRLRREWGTGEPEDGQQVGKCVKMADFTLANNSDLDSLKNNLFSILKNIEQKHFENPHLRKGKNHE